MKIAIRCLYYMPVTPNFVVIRLDRCQFWEFVMGNKQKRMEIIKPFISERHPSIREITWIPLQGMSESNIEEIKAAIEE